MNCPSCSSDVPAGNRFCGACGDPMPPSSHLPTATTPGGQAPRAHRVASETAARFLPGAVIGERYRIVGLLGRGGMGEVYRADDLKLGQAVALKFLPASLEGETGRLERLFAEVRLARQVSHPNVCRVYDAGEAQGQHFISMEYVDGEDLASLLRRIGRYPADRAAQIARQICAGLAAAHQQGILHRDLKPANVLIDGRGRARISDFGLAGLAAGIDAEEVRAGTPAYQAPEQMAGREVTERSDLYALGLILYEIFTGSTPWPSVAAPALMDLRLKSAPGPPSARAEGIDPGVDAVLLRCLDPDPAHRPTSALVVAAALPGGDPLAAAIAAGETPSPDLVAASGPSGAISQPVALACLAIVLLGMAAVSALNAGIALPRMIGLPLPPEALAVRAREILAEAGYRGRPRDIDYGFEYDSAMMEEFRRNPEEIPDPWGTLNTAWPPPIRFWYRESPRYLKPRFGGVNVSPTSPDWSISGMAGVVLDPSGRLLSLRVTAPEIASDRRAGGEFDWKILFDRAGLDMSGFTPAQPRWNPEGYAEDRRAWTGRLQPADRLRSDVEAGAFLGRPVSFEIYPPWATPVRSGPEPGIDPPSLILLAAFLTILTGGVLVARKNLKMGRGDRSGAMRIATLSFALTMALWLFRADHVPDSYEIRLLVMGLMFGLFQAALFWFVYIALEPYARRLWPQSLISWSRLLAARGRDPMVGRDILVGAAAGIFLLICGQAGYLMPTWMGGPRPEPIWGSLASFPQGVLTGLASVPAAISYYLYLPQFVLVNATGVLFLMVLLRRLFRSTWLAGATMVIFLLALDMASARVPMGPGLPLQILGPIILIVLLTRLGWLALMMTMLFAMWPRFALLTTDFSVWYAGRTVLLLTCLAGLAVYGYVVARGSARTTALAGRPPVS